MLPTKWPATLLVRLFNLLSHVECGQGGGEFVWGLAISTRYIYIFILQQLCHWFVLHTGFVVKYRRGHWIWILHVITLPSFWMSSVWPQTVIINFFFCFQTSKYYKGGFDHKMTKREASLVLGVRLVDMFEDLMLFYTLHIIYTLKA